MIKSARAAKGKKQRGYRLYHIGYRFADFNPYPCDWQVKVYGWRKCKPRVLHFYERK